MANVPSGPEKGIITKGVFSLEESLESLKSLNSLKSLEHGRIFLCFPEFGDSLKSLESLNSLESLENGLFWKDPFSKRPLFPNLIPLFYSAFLSGTGDSQRDSRESIRVNHSQSKPSNFRFARIGWFAPIGNSSDSCESATKVHFLRLFQRTFWG